MWAVSRSISSRVRLASTGNRRYPCTHNNDGMRRGARAQPRKETKMQPLSRHACGMLLVLALAGCSRDEPPAPVAVLAAPTAHPSAWTDDELALILPDLMDLVVDPAAGVLFAAAEQHARTDLEPRTAEAWQAVVDAAAQLVQTSDALAEPALARGRADWFEGAAAMREGAAAASTASKRHDPRSLYAAGLQLRASCQACHARYAVRMAEPLAMGVNR